MLTGTLKVYVSDETKLKIKKALVGDVSGSVSKILIM